MRVRPDDVTHAGEGRARRAGLEVKGHESVAVALGRRVDDRVRTRIARAEDLVEGSGSLQAVRGVQSDGPPSAGPDEIERRVASQQELAGLRGAQEPHEQPRVPRPPDLELDFRPFARDGQSSAERLGGEQGDIAPAEELFGSF